MDFGMISYDGLTEEQFMLPQIPQPYLPGNRNKNPLLYLGLSNWDYKEEEKKKNIPGHPPGTLSFYAEHFTASELTITHDEIITADKISKWQRSVSRTDFKFCPQFYKGISHTGKMDTHKLGLTNEFISKLKSFEPKLGCTLLQLPETADAENRDGLIRYLEALPKDLELAVELRHESWFTNPDLIGVFAEQLNRINKSLVITDTPGRRDAVHMQLSNAIAFIRFYGEGWNELDLFRISQWKKQLHSWFLQGLEKCYFFLHISNKEGEDDFISYTKEELKF